MPSPHLTLSCLAHQINDSCDCRCQFCQVWRRSAEPSRSLRLSEIEALHTDAAALGITTYIVYGGEPLLRPDLPDILRSAKRCGMRVFLCSNSGRLEAHVDELAPLIDLFLISIDGDAAVHDDMRGHPGLYAKALRGIEKLQGRGPEIRIWSHLHRGNAETLTQVAQLAARLDVRVDFFPTHSTGRYVNDLALDAQERASTFGRVAELKREGFPIETSEAILDAMAQGRAFRCRWPAEAAYVAHDGSVRSCERLETKALGNVREEGLGPIVRSDAFARAARELEACNACALPCVMSMAQL